MEQITLVLFKAEAEDIAKVLGNLPTQSNAFFLWQKVLKQIDEQTPAQNSLPGSEGAA